MKWGPGPYKFIWGRCHFTFMAYQIFLNTFTPYKEHKNSVMQRLNLNKMTKFELAWFSYLTDVYCIIYVKIEVCLKLLTQFPITKMGLKHERHYSTDPSLALFTDPWIPNSSPSSQGLGTSALTGLSLLNKINSLWSDEAYMRLWICHYLNQWWKPTTKTIGAILREIILISFVF